jgi:hypothetical protein
VWRCEHCKHGWIPRTGSATPRAAPTPPSAGSEEIGELARAIRKGDEDNLAHEFGDVLAWLASLANLMGVDLEDAVARYADGCPRCGLTPCDCPL